MRGGGKRINIWRGYKVKPIQADDKLCIKANMLEE
jgi:hypothetical protein